jgi:hypothetical protein
MVDATVLHVINRNAKQLITEMPSVVMAVPGMIYSAEWNIAASFYPIMDFTELESKIAKSGTIAHDVDQLEKRGGGVMAPDKETQSFSRFRTQPKTEPVDDEGDVVDETSIPG